jgi:hypothetical protein
VTGADVHTQDHVAVCRGSGDEQTPAPLLTHERGHLVRPVAGSRVGRRGAARAWTVGLWQCGTGPQPPCPAPLVPAAPPAADQRGRTGAAAATGVEQQQEYQTSITATAGLTCSAHRRGVSVTPSAHQLVAGCEARVDDDTGSSSAAGLCASHNWAATGRRLGSPSPTIASLVPTPASSRSSRRRRGRASRAGPAPHRTPALALRRWSPSSRIGRVHQRKASASPGRELGLLPPKRRRPSRFDRDVRMDQQKSLLAVRHDLPSI